MLGQTSFRFVAAAPPLNRYVCFLYRSAVERGFSNQVVAQRVPELEPQLVFVIEEGRDYPASWPFRGNLRASLFLQPAHAKTIAIPGSIREAVGASFHATGLRLLFPRGVPALSRLERIPLEDLWGRRGHTLLEQLLSTNGAEPRLRLLEDSLTALALAGTPTSQTAQHSLRMVIDRAGDVAIDRLAADCGVSARALHRSLTAETGLAPKQLTRLVRIRKTLDRLNDFPSDGTLSDLSLAAGFSDQSHMTREFRALLATSPDRLRRDMVRRQQVPRYSADRDLLGTGLLVLPSAR